MSHSVGETSSGNSHIGISDICGVWEVIRISREDPGKPIYPWVKDRFKYSFQPEMFFICLQNGSVSHGTWDLSEKNDDTQRSYSIILNETFEYVIVAIDDDELVLSDQKHEYLLYRKL